MNGTHALADRLMHIDWDPAETNPRLRLSLMREYLRRSAQWADRLGAEASWPFFDVAALIDPSVRADPELIERVGRVCALQSTAVRKCCEGALHFAALKESGTALPRLPDPYEPVVSLFEHGGGFGLDGTGMIDVDATVSLGRGSLADWLPRADSADAVIERLLRINWTNLEGHNAHAASMSKLMIEYLRRAALWAEALGGPPKWPVFDIAGVLAPDVHVDAELAERLEEFLASRVGGLTTENACRAAVRWATLRDTTGVQVPDLPDPFEPLILMYERGGEIVPDDSWAFNFGILRVQIRPWREHLSPEPATSLDTDALDAVDAEYDRARSLRARTALER
ncbi:hypothetical protein ACIBCA_00490 [Kitasatospora sp. NPDC051170]|uniref:hypothetical protein n=1 Tax=Kitasatospora sp. NPDC051170 TaxID=3364056 RepID=UPI0037AC8123